VNVTVSAQPAAATSTSVRYTVAEPGAATGAIVPPGRQIAGGAAVVVVPPDDGTEELAVVDDDRFAEPLPHAARTTTSTADAATRRRIT
jgi:hypothetical protein